jgi:hypothetical protein
LFNSKFRSVVVLLGAAFALLACGTDKDASTAPAEQNPTHLAKVQALGLESITEGSTVVYYSKAREPRARAVLAMVGGFLARYTATYGAVTLHVAVLTEPDWKATIENPYGVPGIRDPGDKPIAFMPADVEQGTLYRRVVALADSLPAATKDDITAKCGSLSACTLQYADLIILHEISHVYVERIAFGRPNMWVGELAPDYLVYQYLRGEQRPELGAWGIMNAVMARMAPHVKSLDELEQRRREEGALDRLEPELPRLHGILMERIPEVHERVGADFLPRLVKAFPRQDNPTGCGTKGLNAGICRSHELPEAEVLRRLDAITPGFTAWAASYGTARR